MRIFSISDLHLPFGADKPMDIFGGWDNYTNKLKENWQKIVKEEDYVILPGDFSWTLKLDDSLPDFNFLHALNGKKILLKGNHDYWWSTASKINSFLTSNKFDDISILHNNAYLINGYSICGTRGWVYDGNTALDDKVIAREAGRLETSIKMGIDMGGKPLVFLHYPFAYGDYVCNDIFEVLKKYEIKDVYFGHIHGLGRNKLISEYQGIKLHIVSCDLVDFVPRLVI